MAERRRGAALRAALGRLLHVGARRPGRGPARPGTPVPRGTRPTYAPRADGLPDPGEVVWTWVPYEDDPARGKDRPVLVLALEGQEVLGLMLTSKDHDRDAADEARHGRRWMDVGTGGWDAQRRPSEVRLDRVLRLPADDVRREGAALDRDRYAEVTAAAARLHGW